MRNWFVSALAVGAGVFIFMMGGPLHALQTNAQNDDAKWINRLESTPVSQMEDGLPNKPFGAWLSEHTRDADVNYMIEACDGSAHTESLENGTFSCVTVTSVRGANSESVMRFLVTGDHQGHYTCKFVIGQEGPPPGSAMKRPTRVFRKLSEMTARLAPQ